MWVLFVLNSYLWSFIVQAGDAAGNGQSKEDKGEAATKETLDKQESGAGSEKGGCYLY